MLTRIAKPHIVDFIKIPPIAKNFTNIFVKFKKRDGVKITPLNLEFAAFDDERFRIYAVTIDWF